MKNLLVGLLAFLMVACSSPVTESVKETSKVEQVQPKGTVPKQIAVVGICVNREIATMAFKALKEGDVATLQLLGMQRACQAIPTQKAPLMEVLEAGKDFEGDEVQLVRILSLDGATEVYTIYFPMHDKAPGKDA